MDIIFSAANTVGLNNPGTEIITLVKDGSGNFINPPSYDKMRAYLRSGEVPMLFVTAEGGETGSLYQLDEYSETENKIRFSNSANAIEFCAGCDVPVVSEVVPKPLTYDYMPEGYPTKAMGTVTVMEEQEVAFALENGVYSATLTNAFEIIEGQTYTVSWDGTEYECVCFAINSIPMLGNLSIFGTGDDTGEPFICSYNKNKVESGFATLDTSANHTISVKTTAEVITPIDEKYLPTIPADKLPTIPADKLPTIPADKLPAIPVIEFTANISDNIANAAQPSFDVSNLSYSEIYSIVEKGNFQIKDSGGNNYRPIYFRIDSSGTIFVSILVFTSTWALYAELACDADQTRFYRNIWGQIEATRK